MKFADRVKQSTTSTSAASIALTGTVATFRTFAAAFAIGDTGISICMDDGKGNWELGAYTLTSATVLTRTAIFASSSGGAAVTFPSGAKEVFCTVSAKALAEFVSLADGIAVGDLPATNTIGANDYVAVTKTSGDFKMKFSDLVAAIGGNPPASDTTAPSFVSALLANATPSRVDITFSESLANSVPPASAFTVSGGKTVSSVSVSGAVVSVTVNSAYVAGNTITVGYTQPGANPRIQDGAGNLAATFSGRAVTNNVGQAATAPAAPTIGTAVAGDGYVDVAFTRNSNGGSAVLDSTATLSTGQTETGTTSPIRVTAPNGAAVTATVRDRNAIGQSAASAASNSVTPQSASSGPTLGQRFSIRRSAAPGGADLPAVSPPVPGNISTNGYYSASVDLYIRDADGIAAKSSEVVAWTYGKRDSQGNPVKPVLANQSQNGQQRPPNPLGGWNENGATNQSYYGLYSTVNTMYVWGTAGIYDLWMFFSDGSAAAYDNGTGTPIGVVLT